jgi:low temperature requirement protein LtrA
MTQREWWERPKLRIAEGDNEERRVSWLELFFDLVFVVVISQAAHYLAEHASLEGAIGYVLLFLPIWWVWIGGTFYNARFETSDISYRIFTLLQMLPVAAMAVFAHGGLGTTSAQFALSYAAARALIILLWARGGWHVPIMRPVTNRYVAGFSISMLLFVISVFVPPPLRFVLWGVGLAIDLLTPVTTLAHQARLPRLSNAKLPERYGLFVIIVLGEAIIGAINGVAERELFDLGTGINGTLGVTLAFCLWWIYFDFIARHAEFRRPRPGVWWTLAWGYLHLPLVMGIAAVGAGTLDVLVGDGETVAAPIRWLLAIAVATVLVCIALIEMTLRREPDEPTHLRTSVALKLAGSLLVLAIGALGSGLAPPALLGVLLPPLLMQMLYGAYVWFRSPVSARSEIQKSL